MSIPYDHPLIVPEKICWFLEIPVGTMLTRAAVTNRIFKYMMNHNLHTSVSNFKCDEKIANLFELDNESEFSTITLPNYIIKHYTVEPIKKIVIVI